MSLTRRMGYDARSPALASQPPTRSHGSRRRNNRTIVKRNAPDFTSSLFFALPPISTATAATKYLKEYSVTEARRRLSDKLAHKICAQPHVGEMLPAHVDLGEDVLIADRLAPRVDVVHHPIHLKICDHLLDA